MPDRTIDLNADVGEGYGAFPPAADYELLPLLSSANVACGFHAGDPLLMMATVAVAKEPGIAVGAHPGYPDLLGFGRRAMAASPEEIMAYVIYQIGALAACCTAAGTALRYVKPHGALYHRAVTDDDAARAIAEGIRRVNPALVLLALPGSRMLAAGTAAGLRVAREGFADRRYGPDGALVPRTEPDALLLDPAAAAAQAIALAPAVDSICVHSDTPGAIDILRAVRIALEAEGYTIAPFAA
ncbi:MAG: LamB/YcsF family protein [Gemmatimonadota bacterium]